MSTLIVSSRPCENDDVLKGISDLDFRVGPRAISRVSVPLLRRLTSPQPENDSHSAGCTYKLQLQGIVLLSVIDG